jgi:hypothetical protein
MMALIPQDRDMAQVTNVSKKLSYNQREGFLIY